MARPFKQQHGFTLLTQFMGFHGVEKRKGKKEREREGLTARQGRKLTIQRSNQAHDGRVFQLVLVAVQAATVALRPL